MKNKLIRVILSTNGPLHLIKSAEYLYPLVDIHVIQGWIPSWWNKWLLKIASLIEHRDLFRTISKRTPKCLEGRNIGLSIPDFYYWGCRLFHLTSSQKASINSALLFGKLEQRYLHDGDIFHVRSGSGAAGAIEKAKKNGMKVVVDHSIAHPAFMERQLRDEYTKYGVNFDLGLDNPFWAEIVEECKKGDKVLVNSQFVKDTFVKEGFNPNKIEVILLGVRQDFQYLKKDYALKNGCLRILFTGGFGFRKGAEYILKALRELDNQGFNYEMTVVGDYRGALPLIDKYKPQHLHLVSTVPQDELKSFLANSDVYLFPSLCEGCASSGMEALAAGLPVIATIESGLPIDNGINGIIIPSKNEGSIVSSLKNIASSEEKRMSLGIKAADKIANKYTWQKYAQNVYKLYQQLMNA